MEKSFTFLHFFTILSVPNVYVTIEKCAKCRYSEIGGTKPMNERKIKREVVAKNARYQKGVLRMVRPIFRPLEYEDRKSVV